MESGLDFLWLPGEPGLQLLLDEPINHLDIPPLSLEQARVFEGTVLAVVHDRYFITGFASEIWQCSRASSPGAGWIWMFSR
jgi:ATPase subunit of ABC transporter with duplicated ATPase domains